MQLSSLGILICLLAIPPIRSPNDPREPKREDVDISYGGTVTAVTKDSITIRYMNWTPKTFAVSDTLARGDFSMQPRYGYARGRYNVGTR